MPTSTGDYFAVSVKAQHPLFPCRGEGERDLSTCPTFGTKS